MNVSIRVRLVRTARDGAMLKWIDENRSSRQRKCKGKTQRSQEAERKSLEQSLNDRTKDMTWSDFWDQCLANHLVEMSDKHRRKCMTMQRRLTEAAGRLGIGTLRCSDLNAALLLEVQSEMRRVGNEAATIKSNMDTLWSLLTWGHDHDLVPPIPRPRRRRGKKAKQARKSKGRSLTKEEIERIEDAVPLVCKSDELPAGFLRAMKTMELIGMRLTEAWLFCWEPIDGVHYPIRLDRSNPAVVFSDEQKSGIEQEVPLTPEAAAWLRSVTRGDSIWICRTSGARGEHKTPNRLGRVISLAGQKAGVVVKRRADRRVKCATAHDLRRTFAANLHQRLNVSELQKMTRHSNVNVLLDYYADVSTPVLMEKLNRKVVDFVVDQHQTL